MKKIKHYTIPLLSTMFSVFMVVGYSFLKTNSFELLYKDVISILCNIIFFILYYFVFYIAIKYIYYKLDTKDTNKVENIKITKLFKKFDDHPFIFSLIFILICWLPYIIAFYPAILSPDPSFQIKQFFNIPNKYSDYSVMIDENVLITNHHPVIHTLLLGGCVKLGRLISSTNLGLFIYSIIQTTILSCTLAYTIYFMKKINVGYRIRKYSLFIYALVPIFPFYAMSTVKDVIFGALIILYIITLYRLSNTKNISIKEMIYTCLLLILVFLFRNNGIYVIVLSFPFLLFLKKEIKKLLIILFIVIVSYVSYSKVILPMAHITPSSIREVLSIPFQQSARYVKEHDDIDEDEMKAIDKLLDISSIALRYNPNLADPVKNEFNKYYTKEDLKQYFKMWFKGLTKHPLTYVEATVNNTYGYFYPGKVSWYIYYKLDTKINEDGFDYHYNSLKVPRKVLSYYGKNFNKIPIFGLLVNIAFNVWMVFFMFGYTMYRKKYKYLIYLLPAVVSILVCIASPANAYFRYAIPFIFAMPFMVAIFSKIGSEGNEKNSCINTLL